MMGVYIHNVELDQMDKGIRLKGTITRRHNDRIFFFLVKQSHNGIASKRPIIKDSRYIYENSYCRVQYINDGDQ